MLQRFFFRINDQPRIHFWTRVASGLVLLLLFAANIYNTSFWAGHASLGIDIDYDSGRIMQIFLGSENNDAVRLDDRVIEVNGKPAAEFRALRDLHPGEYYTLSIETYEGDQREITLRATKPDGMFLWEHSLFPFVGLIFYIFGVALIMTQPLNQTTALFAVYMLISAILYTLFNIERYIQGGTGFFTQLAMMLVVLAGIEFHWVFLNIQLSKKFLQTTRWIIVCLSLFYIVAYFVFPNSPFLLQKIVFYVYWISGFLYILGLFTMQYVYDELSRGMLRILLLTFFASIGPMIYFVLIPLMLNYPRTMPTIISIIPTILLPLNYSLMIQRKTQYGQVTCTILSFMLTLMIVYFLVEVGFAVLDQWIPGFNMFQRDWFSQFLLAVMIGSSIVLNKFVSQFVQRFVYGDVSGEARQMQQLSIDLQQSGDINIILGQTAQVFQKFFNFDYLKISLQDGTCLEFVHSEPVVITTVDRIAVFSVLNRITFRKNSQGKDLPRSAFIDLESIHDLIQEYGQIFGTAPAYVFLLDGRSYPMGVISAGARKNGERFDALEIQQLDALLGQYQTIVENLFLMDEVEKRSQQVRKMGQQLLAAREDERKRIARDMHDNIIQSLTAFRYSMNDLYDQDKLAISDEEADELQRSLQIISQDIRDICFNLRPPALDATGFRSAVVSIVEIHHRNNHLHINLEISDSAVIDQLSDMVSICLYRVLQEALVNIGKHASTESVWVQLDATEDSIRMRVEDNGVGFVVPENLSELVTQGHYGLTGIQEFLEIVNGSLAIHSQPGEGSYLIARIPLIKTGGEDDLFYDYRR